MTTAGVLAVMVVSMTLAVSEPASAKPPRQLDTGLLPASGTPAEQQADLERSVDARASLVRIGVPWAVIAATQPAQPTDPADPAYRFDGLDQAVSQAKSRGLDVMLTLAGAPPWAEGPGRPADAGAGTWRPDPSAYANFARAVAVRYSGSYAPVSSGAGPLPRVRYYQAWNEPNISNNLAPQSEGRKIASVGIFRALLNGLYDQVKSVSRRNVVITGGTAPFGDDVGGDRIRPLRFWRKLLCVNKRGKRTACPERAKFDILAHHPINTVGGPHDSAVHPEDVTVPDMKNLRRVLRTAERRHTISGRGHPLWVTELWWETKPPDPTGVSLKRQARWVSESLYELWRQGVRAVFWLGIRDFPYSGKPGRSELQSGLLFEDGRAKPSFTAFRFPLVADRLSKRRALVWTIPPDRGKVRIESRRGGRWRTIATPRGKPGRVLSVRVRASRRASFRARVGDSRSLSYRLRRN